MMPRSRATAGAIDPAEVEQGRRFSSFTQITRTAFFAGAIAGAATGLIDGLWTWDRLSQFAVGTTKVRALFFLAALYATAGAFAAPVVAVGSVLIARATRLSDLVTALDRRAPVRSHRVCCMHCAGPRAAHGCHLPGTRARP